MPREAWTIIQNHPSSWDVFYRGRIFQMDLSSEDEAMDTVRSKEGRGTAVLVTYTDGYQLGVTT